MKKIYLLLEIMCLIVIFTAVAKNKELYKVGVGDVLRISVLGHEELTSVVTVNPDGTIMFPYAGIIQVKGYTLAEIKEKITSKLSPDYIKYPEVVIHLEETKSKKFYVYGEVKNPGVYNLTDKMTVLKAVSMAGGYTAYANTRKVKILRPREDKSGYKEININIEDMVKNPGSQQDVVIEDEDIIVVMEK